MTGYLTFSHSNSSTDTWWCCKYNCIIQRASDISYNNFDVSYNLQSNGIPITMSDTKKIGLTERGAKIGINSNTGVPDAKY